MIIDSSMVVRIRFTHHTIYIYIIYHIYITYMLNESRFSLVIRSLLMQEGICMCLNPEFSIIEASRRYGSVSNIYNVDITTYMNMIRCMILLFMIMYSLCIIYIYSSITIYPIAERAQVALPYASKRLLSDPNPTLRRELLSVVFSGDERPVLQSGPSS